MGPPPAHPCVCSTEHACHASRTSPHRLMRTMHSANAGRRHSLVLLDGRRRLLLAVGQREGGGRAQARDLLARIVVVGVDLVAPGRLDLLALWLGGARVARGQRGKQPPGGWLLPVGDLRLGQQVVGQLWIWRVEVGLLAQLDVDGGLGDLGQARIKVGAVHVDFVIRLIELLLPFRHLAVCLGRWR